MRSDLELLRSEMSSSASASSERDDEVSRPLRLLSVQPTMQRGVADAEHARVQRFVAGERL